MTPQHEEARRLLRLAARDQTAFKALRVVPEVDIAVALFHAQQSVEKTLKAMMCLHELEYRRTHDLEELAARLTTAGVLLPVTEEQLSRLTPYAVEFRYDDGAFHLLSAEEADHWVAVLFAWAREAIENAQ